MASKILLVLFFSGVVFLRPTAVFADWPTVGHDFQRTSYAPEIISTLAEDTKKISWYKEISEYIPSRTQIITADDARGGTVYVSTAKGLYALNPTDGSTRWFYQTIMPVGNSPTVVNDVVYLPCLDKTIHAINAATGLKIWQTDQAGAGFYATPIVVDGRVYNGNRDGYFYAFDSSSGQLIWNYPDVNTYPTGYISQSPAISQDKATLFFATSDSYAVALNASTGSLKWKTARFPGGGFHAFWPVFYNGNPASTADDRVIFVRAENFPVAGGDYKLALYQANIATINGHSLLYDASALAGKTEVNGSEFIQWLSADPDRQTVYVLDPVTGTQKEVAPILMWGDPDDNHYPPALGPDGRLWFLTPWVKTYFGSGRYAGWLPGSTTFKPLPGIDSEHESSDEPEAISIFGGGLFHNDGGDGVDKGGIANLNGGSTAFWYTQTFRDLWPSYGLSWQNYKYGNGFRLATGWAATQGTHGIQNAPVPLKNRFFFHRSNNVISFCRDNNEDNLCDP